MSAPQYQPVLPVIRRLLRKLKADFPHVRPFEDWQDWEIPVSEAPLPGSFGVVLAVPEQEHFPYTYLPAIPNVSVRVLTVTGPARLFVVGWDEEAGLARGISERLWQK